LAKNFLFRVQKYLKNFVGFLFVKRLIKTLGKIFGTQKQIAKIMSPLGATRARSLNLCAAEFPNYNSDPVKQVSKIPGGTLLMLRKRM